MYLECNFHFHAVGQGCFYSGKIKKSGGAEFHFVYDCGTLSNSVYLEEEIQEYKSTLINNKLDMLIISHFDADHVNGVVKLLKGIKCRRLVLPYYDVLERLFLCVTSSYVDNNLYRMIRSPVSYFSAEGDFNIDEVVLVGGPGDIRPHKADKVINEPTPPSRNRPRPELEEGNFEFNDGNLIEVSAVESASATIKADSSKNLPLDKVKVLRYPYVTDVGVWSFHFYLKKQKNSKLTVQFRKDVEKLLTKYDIPIFALFSKEYIDELKSLYRRRISKNLNVTTLALLHDPLVDDSWCKHGYIKDKGYQRYKESKTFGTLLTGDLPLQGARASSDFLNHFSSSINQVVVFQVPHHGSRHNWPFKVPNGFHQFPHYVVNHGFQRGKHPSADVVDYIMTYCKPCRFHSNHEGQSFFYHFVFHN